MIWLIAKKELYDNWQSHRITLAFALCAILLTMSVWLGLRDYSQRLEAYNLSRARETLFSYRFWIYRLLIVYNIANP